MSRLTKGYEKHNNEFISYVADISLYPEMMGYEQTQAEMDAINKLGRLEDLEEELGIDLITLFKAKKEGIYYKTINHNIYYISKNSLCLEFNYEWELWVENHSILEGLLIHLKDYGKTWSLSRSELEEQNNE